MPPKAEEPVFMQTFTARTIDLKNPDPDQIDIMDIAHGLSHVCRFAGQAKFFYSVAQHSVHVAEMCLDQHALVGLLHDATEAYLGDVPSPVKHLCPDYKRLEKKLWGAIAEKFDLPKTIPKAVKDVDLRMLATERPKVFDKRIPWGPLMDKLEPYPIQVEGKTSIVARSLFLGIYSNITGERMPG